MNKSLWVFVLTCILVVVQPFIGLAQDSGCPDAPLPQLVVGEQGQVAPGSANNMRDTPSTGGARVGTMDSGEIFIVLEGPICAEGYNWWRVDYNGTVGWTVEGQGDEYWVVPVRAPAEASTPAPVLTPVNTSFPAVDLAYVPPLPIVNVRAIGTQVRVNTSGDQLRVRAEPGTGGAVVTRLDDGVVVTLTDGPRVADGFRWWQIETADAQSGWTIEAVVEFIGGDERGRPFYVQTLVPICPYSTDRLAFVANGTVMTSDMAGERVCSLPELIGPDVHTFWSYFSYMPNSVHWSPDGSQLMYISWPTLDDTNYDLYTITPDGATIQRLTMDSNILWADWSPDGSRIALARTLAGQLFPQIWVMDADGSRPVALTQENTLHPWVEWLDNDTVVYVEQSQRLLQVYREITYTFHVIGANGSSPRVLWTTTMDVRDVRVSPDGTQLAVSGFVWINDEPATPQVIVLDVATGEVTLTHEGSTRFLWSPDNRIVVLEQGQFIIMGMDGTETRFDVSVISLNTSDDSAWAADGTSFYLSANGSVMVVDVVDGNVTTLLNSNATIFEPVVQPAGQ